MDFDMLIAEFREKLDKELLAFRNSYNEFSVTQTYNDWYIIAFYEMHYEVLTSDYIIDHLDTEVLEWLSAKDKPLEYLYNQWESCDGSLSHDWDDMIDFVRVVYVEDKHQEKQNLYIELKNLAVEAVKKPGDDYFNQFDYFCHVTDSPAVFSAEFPDNFDDSVDREFGEFFTNNLSVKCCDFGCDTFPNGVSKEVAPDCVQTYQQHVWNFIEAVEQMFNCKCNYYDNVNGFEFAFELSRDSEKGCYVFCAGNNGQEYSECLYLTDLKLIQDPEVVKTISTIDRALYVLLEEHGLRFDEAHVTSLEDKITSAEKVVEAPGSHKKVESEKSAER